MLLVGGASTRFGSPKALAQLDGETLAERAWRLLGEACDERIAVGKRSTRSSCRSSCSTTAPTCARRSPGVVAGLRAAAHDVAVVIPVDMPMLTADGAARARGGLP